MKRKYFKWIAGMLLIVILSVITVVALTQQKDENATDEDKLVTAVDLTGGVVTNDNAWAEMSKMLEVYTIKKYLNVSGTIQLFNEENSTQPEETQPFAFEVNGKQFCNRIGPVETIYNGSRFIYIDNEQKSIHLTGKENTSQNLFSLDSLKTLMKSNESNAQVLSLSGEKIIALLNINHPTAHHVLIYYSPQNYHISKIVTYISEFNGLAVINAEDDNENAVKNDATEKKVADEANVEEESDLAADISYYKMVINYSRFFSGNIKTDFKPELKYFSVDGGKITAKKNFENYEIISSDENR